MQEICDECYEQFLSIVKEDRNMMDEYARKLADGRIYTASQALKNGLIDKISDWDSMIRDLSFAISGTTSCNVKTFRYERKLTFMEQLMTTLSGIKPAIAESNTAMPMYIYQK